MSVSSEDSDRPRWSGHDPWRKVRHAPGAYPVSPNLEATRDVYGHHSVSSAVRARKHEYTRKKQVKIKVGTWNTASVSGTAKDLGGWFVQGLGVKGLHQDLSGLSLGTAAPSRDRHIESVEEQEARARKKSCTLPKHESPAIASEDEVGLYVLGLQEVVDVASVTEVIRPFYDSNPGKKWKQAMTDSLPDDYVKISEMQLLGLLILVYAAPEVACQISSVDATSVGTGALGYAGNKGAVSVRIVLGGTTRVLFVNCHLAAGADDAALTRRIWDTNQILSRTKFEPADVDDEVAYNHESIGDEDFAFWFGDLNYRLDDIPGEDVRRLLLLHTRNEYDVMNKSKRKIDSELGYVDAPSGETSSITTADDIGEGGKPARFSSAQPKLNPNDDPASLITTIKSLLVHDQLKAQQKLRKAFHEGWREGDIGFLPTYKYDVGSVGMFDSGEKKRSPSWCDRILYRTRRDKLEYDDRIAHEAETNKRDNEMKARGVEEAVAEHEVLFNYIPETDGDNDYDEYDENDGGPQDIQRVMTHEGFEDIIQLEDYVSHQRVLSSDHKPLSAVFTLTYDAIIPELKSRVHHEVTKEFDKTENEGRPSITLVVENPSGAAKTADPSTGATELNAVVFDKVRYKVPQTRVITIANTSPIPATFAFIDRPPDESGIKRPAAPWLSIHIDQDSQAPIQTQDELEASVRFTLDPGEVTDVSVTINIADHMLVQSLNEGRESLDDVLVLRVLKGRDHFIRVTGIWLPSSFCRSLSDLTRFRSGVRHAQANPNATAKDVNESNQRAHHSAPGELYALTEAIPGLVERATAEWAMLHEGKEAPWIKDSLWPFSASSVDAEAIDERQTNLTAIREALDTGASFDEHLDVTLSPLHRVELLSETLLAFLESLQDGIITPELWSTIESKFIASEKTNTISLPTDTQEMVMDILSTSSIHSVSITFITFMLNRIITDLSTFEPSSSNTLTDPQPPQSTSTSRSRSSTRTSETYSEVSLSPSQTSTTTTSTVKSKLSFLPSLTRRLTTNTTPIPPNPTPTPALRSLFTKAYIDKFAPILIRAEGDSTLKTKEKKLLETRKKKVLGIFLTSGMS